MLPDPSAVPPSVRLGSGAGGLPVIWVTGRAGSAEIYLHGAQVTAWAPVGAEPVLWMSAASRFAAGAAIRGGVPICFPWFGNHPQDPAAPAHGFARLVSWELAEAEEAGDDVRVSLRLRDTAATRSSAWPHRFEARYTITVGARLTLSLRVVNRDPVPVTIAEALHTYLRVGDIRSTTVGGLEGTAFIDRLAGPGLRPGESGPVRFAGETDRIYVATSATTTVTDRAAGRSITIATSGSHSTVVWNPWAAKAAALTDFGDKEWTGMVCVETANLGGSAVRLAPGSGHTMTAVLDVS